MTKNRRTFIKVSSAAAAGMLIIPGCGQQEKQVASEAISSAAKANEDIGLGLYTVRDQMKDNLEATMEAVAQAGYTEVEIFDYDDGKYFGRPVAEFYKIMQDNGLEIISGHYHTGRINGDKVGTMMNGWQKAVEDASMAEQRYMVCAWLFEEERSAENYRELPELLNKAAETCQAAGIQLCYHNHDFEFFDVDGMVPMYHILDNTDPGNLKVELDLYWITKAGYDPVEFFEKYPGRTALWHVKDMDDSQDKAFTEVGNGTIDFGRIFANREKSGLKHFFVEQDVSPNPLQSIQISYNNVAEIV